MRIGIARSLTDSNSGGVFQYEIVLLKALGEIATNFPEELVYLCYHPNDLSALVSTGGLSYRGIRVAAVGKPINAQAAPEKYLTQKPVTPPPLNTNDVRFDYAVGEALRQDGVELLFLLSPNLPAFSFH